MLRPAISLAPLRTELLQPSLPTPDRSKGRSVMTTGTFVSFLTGLSPAALSALWAAHQTKPCVRRACSKFEFKVQGYEIRKRTQPHPALSCPTGEEGGAPRWKITERTQPVWI